MHYFRSYIAQYAQRILHEKLILCLDFDGTLAPLAPTPHAVVFSDDVRDSLRKLSLLRDCRVVIVSGRKLSNIKRMVGLPRLVYAGNHGFEIQGKGFHFRYPVSRATRCALRRITHAWKHHVVKIPGAWIEDKGMTLSFHYRLVPPSYVRAARSIFRDCYRLFLTSDLTVHDGKKVIELRQGADWNKGAAVAWMLKQQMCWPDKKRMVLYIGDDTTDEDAFRIIGKKGIAIAVGKKKSSAAHFYLRNVHDVEMFLKDLLRIKKEPLS